MKTILGPVICLERGQRCVFMPANAARTGADLSGTRSEPSRFDQHALDMGVRVLGARVAAALLAGGTGAPERVTFPTPDGGLVYADVSDARDSPLPL